MSNNSDCCTFSEQIVHGRISMLAALGFIAQEQLIDWPQSPFPHVDGMPPLFLVLCPRVCCLLHLRGCYNVSSRILHSHGCCKVNSCINFDFIFYFVVSRVCLFIQHAFARRACIGRQNVGKDSLQDCTNSLLQVPPSPISSRLSPRVPSSGSPWCLPSACLRHTV